MFKSVFSLLFTIGFLSTQAQQITFDDLIKMNSEKASAATDFLPQKNKWIEHSSHTSNVDSAVVILKTEVNKQDKSRNWLSIYSENDKPKSISYQTTKKAYIDKIIADLKTAGYTITNSRITPSTITIIYSKDEINIEVTTISSETNPEPVYQVTLNS